MYNIRDWVTSIDSPHFSQTLHYVDGVDTPCYNGNISSMLKDAIYGEGERFTNSLNRFNEQVTGYDKNGNILGLLRYGQINTTDRSIRRAMDWLIT